jgi:hypothetical protein
MCKEVTGIQTSLINLGTNYFDFGICINATSNYVYYTNVSYSWNVAGPSGIVSNGTSMSGLIASGTCESQNNIQTVRVDGLKQNTSYSVSTSVTNAGKNYGSLMTVSTKAGSTATTQTDTKTATTQADTKTATTQADTKTATTQTATKTTATTTTQSETRTAQVAEVVSISNSKERTVAAVELIQTFDSAEKERALDITYKSKKSTVIDVDLAVPGIPVVVTATKKGSPTITLKSTTDAEGDAQIKTTKNLEGYSVTLTVNKTKIDTDVVKKQK